jgi:hypothetical protein
MSSSIRKASASEPACFERRLGVAVGGKDMAGFRLNASANMLAGTLPAHSMIALSAVEEIEQGALRGSCGGPRHRRCGAAPILQIEASRLACAWEVY